MRIKALTLFSSKLPQLKDWYRNNLGFDLLDESEEHFTLQVGWTRLSFQASSQNLIYHYCFLIPSNKLTEAIEWAEDKLDFIKIEGERIIEYSESWNADSVYFYDAIGNIAEFIVRYDLKNEYAEPFDVTQLLCINEIGMCTGNIKKQNEILEEMLPSRFWKGNVARFGTHGDQEGLFLLVNYGLKKTWFPTQLPTASSPFEVSLEIDKEMYELTFRDEIISKLHVDSQNFM